MYGSVTRDLVRLGYIVVIDPILTFVLTRAICFVDPACKIDKVR